MSTMTIRKAQPTDYPDIGEIMASTEAWSDFGMDKQLIEDSVRQMTERIYVAVTEDKVVGVIAYELKGVGNFGAYLRIIALSSHCRGKGWGKILLNYVWDQVRQETSNLFLTCSQGNWEGIRFYEGLGFEKIGVIQDLYLPGHHEILYRKTSGPLGTGIKSV